MQTNRCKLAELNRRLQAVVPKVPRWRDDDGRNLTVGQVWTVAADCGDQPTWMWLILEQLDDRLVNAAPTFIWGELAGPEDVFVPEEWAGAALVVSFELEATVSPSAFGRCEGRLPERAVDFILRARTDRRDTTRRNAYNWGWEYLDEIDRRLAYHLEIAGITERLQQSVRDMVYAGDDLAAVPPPPDIVQFLTTVLRTREATFEPLPAAADTGEDYSRVVVIRTPSGPPETWEVTAAEPVADFRAPCLCFEPLAPNRESPAGLDWQIDRALPDNARVFIFFVQDRKLNTYLGEAGLDRDADGGICISLANPDTADLSETIDSPEQFLVVIAIPDENKGS